MAEAADELGFVHVVRRCLHAADHLHFLVEIQTFLAIARHVSARTLFQHVQLVRIG